MRGGTRYIALTLLLLLLTLAPAAAQPSGAPQTPGLPPEPDPLDDLNWDGPIDLRTAPTDTGCTTLWTCGRYSDCQDNQATRFCYDAGGCTTDLLQETQDCDSGEITQEQLITTAPTSGGGGGGGGGTGRQRAPGEPCSEDWRCDPWNACASGIQKRTCFDAQGCGTITSRPPLTQTCEASCYDRIHNQDEDDTDCGGQCNPCRGATEDTTFLNLAGTSPPTTERPSATTTQEPIETGTATWIILLATALATAAAALITIHVRRIHEYQERALQASMPPEHAERVRAYIAQVRGMGRGTTDIRKDLLQTGYNKDAVEALLRKK